MEQADELKQERNSANPILFEIVVKYRRRRITIVRTVKHLYN